MNFDPSMLIGLIGAVCVGSVLGLSYVGAYLLGHARGRRQADLEERASASYAHRVNDADRFRAVEGALGSMAQAMDRLTEAQHRTVLERARLAAAPEPVLGAPRIRSHDTPA